MNLQAATGQSLATDKTGRTRVGRVCTVLLGTLFLSWPAIYNGFPLLMADSMTYLADGPPVARALFLHRFSDYYGMRSLIYSLTILPFHWNINPFPIVALQSLVAAWVLWLVVRSFTPRHTVARYLILVAALSVLSSVGWYTSFIMPDVLGPLLYLSFYLLAFARETLSRTERIAVYAVAWWGVTAHSTHMLLAIALLGMLMLFAAFERKPFLRRVVSLAELAAIILVAAACELALHDYLDGKPTLEGQRPPYMTARVMADGPGRWYLERHCGTERWAACGYLKFPTPDAGSFLWGPDSPYEVASEDEKRKMEAEDSSLAWATLRAYPRDQLLISAGGFWQQLLAFGLYDIDASEWTLGQFDQVVPASRAMYLRSREARNVLPLDQLTSIQFWTIVGSLAEIAILIPVMGRRLSSRIVGLSVVVLSMVVLNAVFTGVLSIVDERYGCRVIWLIPLLAGMCLLDWLEQRSTTRARAKQDADVPSAFVV